MAKGWNGPARKAFVALLVLALHLPVAYWLLEYPRLHAVPPDPATRFELRLLQPPVKAAASDVPAATRAPATGSARVSKLTEARSRPAENDEVPGPPRAGSVHGGAGALDLSLPAEAIAAGRPAEARQPWERPPPIEYRSTRFDRAWAPDGGPIQQTWAFRSKIAGFVLAATGALDLPCTEEERRQLVERCAGRQYQGDDGPPTAPGRH